jgi:hypothetical protein
MRLFIFSFLLLLGSVELQAQRVCSSTSQASYVPTTFSIASQNNNVPVEQVITIPVVVHVLYNSAAENISEAQILYQI